MNNIKPGLLLKIVSWENDADNYRTWEQSGLTDSEVRFYLLIATLFKSKNNWEDKGFGNSKLQHYTVTEQDIVNKTIDNLVAGFIANGGVVPKDHDKANYEDKEWLEKYGDGFYDDLIYDIIGIWNEGEKYRVYESYSVVEVPEPGLKDVSERFNNIV